MKPYRDETLKQTIFIHSSVILAVVKEDISKDRTNFRDPISTIWQYVSGNKQPNITLYKCLISENDALLFQIQIIWLSEFIKLC